MFGRKRPQPVVINLKGLVVNRGDKLLLIAQEPVTPEAVAMLESNIRVKFGYETPCVIITGDWKVRVVTRMPDRDELERRARAR